VETKEKEDLFFVVAKVLGEGACLRMVCKLSCACLYTIHTRTHTQHTHTHTMNAFNNDI
jgi:hypothetical protein